MKGLVNWFTENSVAANLLMVLLLSGGVSTYVFTIRSEQFPTIPPEQISISVSYPGATPGEVEESICIKIEEAVQAVDDIKRIESTADEHVGSVNIEILSGSDINEVLDDIKTKIDQISTFPLDSEEPIIQKMEITERVISLGLRGDIAERSLKVLLNSLREELLNLPGLTKVEIEDSRPYEVSIEIREQDLRRLQLSFDDVVRAVRGESINLPAGSVKTEGGEILFRSSSQAYQQFQFEKIPLLTQPGGTRILLEDVADIRHGFEDIDLEARIDGKPAQLCQVYRVADQDTPTIARIVHKFVKARAKEMPPGVDLIVWKDESLDLDERMELLRRNGLTGLFMVVFVLAIFLKARLAIWVAIGLTTAILGAVWVMPMFGMTLNFLTSFGFILVLGILVDDAIVVAENIDAHQKMGKSAADAARDGTYEVMVPVSLAVVTTGIAFSPMLGLPGRTGVFSAAIALVVLVAITFSLIESLLILPSHLAHESKQLSGIFGQFQRGIQLTCWPIAFVYNKIQRFSSSALDRFVVNIYQPVLDKVIQYRYATLATGIVLLMFTTSLFMGKHLKVSFFPPIEGNQVIATVRMAEGSNVNLTRQAVAILEQTAIDIRDELEDRHSQKLFLHLRASVGAQRGTSTTGPPTGLSTLINQSHLGEVHIEMVRSTDLLVTAAQVAKLWRDRVGAKIPDALELKITSDAFSAGSPINIELAGSQRQDLQQAASELKKKLETFKGIFNIADDHRSGKLEVSLKLLPSGAALGLTQLELARQVRQGFYGDEVQRVQIGKDNVKVFVRYPRDERRSLADLESIRIRLADRREVPFSEIATYTVSRGPATIKRINRRRTIVVTSDLDLEKGNANDILEDLRGGFLADLAKKYPELEIQYGGEQSRQSDSFSSLLLGMGLAFFLMYALLAMVFRSYIQPLIVLSAIPFGFAGAIWAHYYLGMNLTFLSIIGLLALMGVVVNDSLVLIDFANRFSAEKPERNDPSIAIRRAGVRRFRAILLTSLTTFAGLTPILLERSPQAAFIIPMAVSLAFGIAFATFIILLLVPAMFMVVEDLKQICGLSEAPTRLQTNTGRSQESPS